MLWRHILLKQSIGMNITLAQIINHNALGYVDLRELKMVCWKLSQFLF